MDLISHSLWGGLLIGRKKRRIFIWVVILSVLPDILSEGIMFSFIYLGIEGMPNLADGHPNITDYPNYAQCFYNITHSLIVFIAIFILVWIIRKKIYWPLLAWGIHIVIDIPTHSYALFPTPFLWPISDFKIDGIPWDNPIILIPNFLLLFIFYSFWFMEYKKSVLLKEKS